MVLFPSCLKNWTLPALGSCRLLHGGYQEKSLKGMSPSQRLHKGSTPVCSTCFPTLPSQGGAALFPVQGRQREWLSPCQVTTATVCIGTMCGQQSMVRFTGGSWHSKAALGVSTDALWIFILISCQALFSRLVLVGMSRVMLDGSRMGFFGR